MKNLTGSPLRLCLFAAALGVTTAPAGIISVTSSDVQTGNRATNLVVNGSFETRAGGQPPITTDVCWASSGVQTGGCPADSVSSIPGWTYTAPSGAYGWWGPTLLGGVGPGHGTAVLYFGNWFSTPSLPPTFQSDGQVTFSGGSPTFTNSSATNNAPMVLSQTVNLTVGTTYSLEFYATGEDNLLGFNDPGIFAVEITGQGRIYLAVPAANSAVGRSQRYTVTFQATQAATTLSFMNWGHVGTAGTELILDDVILNGPGGDGGGGGGGGGGVPEPSTFAMALTVVALGLWRSRRK